MNDIRFLEIGTSLSEGTEVKHVMRFYPEIIKKTESNSLSIQITFNELQLWYDNCAEELEQV